MPSASESASSALSGPAIHERWESVYRNPHSERLYELVFDWIAEHGGVPAGSRWLDIGCGIGQHAMRLQRRGYRVVAADFSPDRVRAASAHIQEMGLASDIAVQREDLVAGLSFPAATFDAVLCWGVLMHIPMLETAMSELIRVTRPGGKLFLYEANIGGLDATISRLGSLGRGLLGKSRFRRIVSGPYGREYWVHTDEGGLVIRHARMPALRRFFESHGCRYQARICGEFTEWYGRSGALAPLLHAWNEFWFRSVRSPYLAHGNLLVFEKRR
ncbi:MAG: class I SAM-dependent methyltransferase [Terracidiphilus sp.]